MVAKTIVIPIIITGALFFAASCFHSDKKESSDALPDVVSYNFNIRPILSDKCFKCHGPDANKRQAHLRLDIGDSAYAALKETKGAFAIVPGKPGQSELWKRISSSDLTYMMPPPDAHLGMLNDHEKKLFEKWIEQGGKYEKHWAFVVP
ncbi:MAG TPA: c-type cytochrome domain-containing protein, partial [Puia sp.]|nr:c-type cytochrome domain-containing protein [Puia sp.]